MTLNNNYIGKAVTRTDGPLKVTGQAKYAGEFQVENLAYGYVVESSIAAGKITRIVTKKAAAIEGVLAIFTHENLPRYLKEDVDYSDPLAPPGHPFRPLYNDKILYSGQPIALVIAENFEVARYAAGLVEVSYEKKEFVAILEENLKNATKKDVGKPPKPRGDAAKAYKNAAHKIEATYETPRHYHSPMEPHASTVIWEKDGSLTIYDKVQGVANSQAYICGVFGLPEEKVRVKSPFVGGGFGSGLRPQYQLFMATLAATELKRTVSVTLTRRQMFSFGHRPANIQSLKLAADNNGKLKSITHHSYGETSQFEKYSEDVVSWSGLLYECENVKMDYELVPVDAYTSMDMRGPGGTTGMFALECAIDELATKAGMDPLAFRLLNYAERDQNKDLPFTSKELKACYEQCAEKFGWHQRKAEPKSIKKGNLLVGYGMATGCWEAWQQPASAAATLTDKGHLTVSSATADIGTGTYTVMTQIAAQSAAISMDKVTFELGDTNLPKAPIEGGSWTVASVGTATKKVCHKLHEKLFELAYHHHVEQFKGVQFSEVIFENGQLIIDKKTTFSFEHILKHAGKASITVECKAVPTKESEQYSGFAHSCVMVEVNIDEDLGMITVPRVVNAAAAGKIINPKTAENQLLGATVWGISMALVEEGMVDKHLGRIMNTNLAEYHIAVNADVQDIDIIFVEEKDAIINPLGAKGVGELGIVGVASAIANAVYNATGKRIRKLPITLDKLL